jgi:Cdc6-like AAA superfamily ATPase
VSNKQAYIKLDADSKIISRLGNFEIVFLPYNTTQMMQILNDRKYIPKVFTEEAIKYISLKVANRGGDIRKALDMCEASLTSLENKSIINASINYDIVREIYSARYLPFSRYIKNASTYDKVLIITLSIVSKSHHGVGCYEALELFNQYLDKYCSHTVTHYEFHSTLFRYYRQGLILIDNERILTLQIPTDDLKEALFGDASCSTLLEHI